MLEFVRSHLLLVLSVSGALLSFMASFTGLVSKRKPILFLAILGVLGFVVAIAYQLYGYSEKQEASRRAAAERQIEQAAQRARDNVIDEINLNVQHTRVTVDAIADRLKTTSLSEVATELVTIRTTGDVDFEETVAFAKGSPQMWSVYADWLTTVQLADVAPSLSLTLNAGHHYDSGLLLAYLLTSEATRVELGGVVGNHQAWHTFAAEPLYLKNFVPGVGRVRWVLFYDKSGQDLVAFADAHAFVQELMVYHRLGHHERVDTVFNHPTANPVAALQKVFPSIQNAVFRTASPSELVRVMIDRELAVSVAAAGPRPYVVRLERMIQLASREQ